MEHPKWFLFTVVLLTIVNCAKEQVESVTMQGDDAIKPVSAFCNDSNTKAMGSVIDRLLEYSRIDTHSVQPIPGQGQSRPSNPNQKVLINKLLAELLEMGVPRDWITQLRDGSFLVDFPPTEDHEDAPHVVFASHVDTYFGYPGNAEPRIYVYQGGDLHLPKNDVAIPASDLDGLAGKRIIASDGATLLGGDDKAGVAEIMTFIESMLRCDYAHGPLTVWFCTDEEIGDVGIGFLPKELADKWDIFWSVDGQEIGVVIGCIYAAKVDVDFRGDDTHPGAGYLLKPAHYAASRFIDKLGDVPTPWTTKNDESFIYVPTLPVGTAGKTTITAGLRTFRKEELPDLVAIIKRVAEGAASRYGVTAVVHEIKVLYVPTEIAINANRYLLQPGLDALTAFGMNATPHRVRAGSDGAMLNVTYPKIPAPNLGTGGRNLHSVREFVVVDELELVPLILRDMTLRYAEMKR